jgi:hypothetical protein
MDEICVFKNYNDGIIARWDGALPNCMPVTYLTFRLMV